MEKPATESRSASIFGAAKPVDTTAREREIESRLQQDRGNPPDSDRRLLCVHVGSDFCHALMALG